VLYKIDQIHMHHWSVLLLLVFASFGRADRSECLLDCNSTSRVVNATILLGHPYASTLFSATVMPQFCRAGCSFFYSTAPVLTGCKAQCDGMYAQVCALRYSDQKQANTKQKQLLILHTLSHHHHKSLAQSAVYLTNCYLPTGYFSECKRLG
jgi:hypothetical protein